MRGGSAAEEPGFGGILWPPGARPAAGLDELEDPAFFADLNLDQVVESILAGRGEYRLEGFLRAPLRNADAVAYRHEVQRDLDREPVLEAVRAFAQDMRDVRDDLGTARKAHYPRQGQRWFLDAVATYCAAVENLAGVLCTLHPTSRGLLAFRDHLAAYVGSPAFAALAAETRDIAERLSRVRYSVRIKGRRVRVGHDEGEPDYSAEVDRTFERFKRDAVTDHRVRFPTWWDMNHVEARILELVARLHPEVFRDLDRHHERHRDFLDATIAAFDREIQLYLAYRDFIDPLRSAGLPFCYPSVSTVDKDVHAVDAFDIALAAKLVGEGGSVVPNGFSLRGAERILVVTGPNQGGKTTFARMFGQIHHLASLGLPVPGREARLFLPDGIFTHFERDEDVATLRGKLEDELVRIHDILRRATDRSVVIMNESFASTSLHDALFLGTEILRRLLDLDVIGVCVTFIDELASLGEATVSMVGEVSADDPTVRTFRIARRPADGLAHALAIAERYGLTHESVRRRVAT